MTRKPLQKPNFRPVNKKFSLLGVGLPRTGTGYTHMLLRGFGLDVGHENIRPDGCVDWQFSLQPKSQKIYGKGSLHLFKRGLVIRTARDLSTTIPSFIRKVVGAKPALKFVEKNLNLNLSGLNKLEKCVEIMFAFEKAIDLWKPDYIFKIESDSSKLYKFLSQHYPDLHPFNQSSADKVRFYNSHDHMGWTPGLIKMRNSLSNARKNKINIMCRKHNYPLMFK